MPAAHPDSTTRYGRARRAPRWVLLLVAAVLIAVGVSWAWWASHSLTDPPVSAQVQSFEVQSEHGTDITLRIHRDDPDAAAKCEVYAETREHVVVGERRVEVAPAARQTVTVTATIRTERGADNALVRSCRLTD